MSAAARVGRDVAVYNLGLRVELDAAGLDALPGSPGSVSPDGEDVDAPVSGADLMLGSIVEELQHLASALLRSHGFPGATVTVDYHEGGVRYIRTYRATLTPEDVVF